MADPVYQFLEVASREVAKRELGYDQQMIEEDPEKAEAVHAMGKRFMDDVDDIVTKLTATLAEKYNLKYIPDKMRISLYEAIATEAYLGNISLKSIENNEFVQSTAETEAKEQKRVEVVQEIMDKCADAAFAYTVASAVTISAMDSIIPEKKAFEAVKAAVVEMNAGNVIQVRKILEEYNKSEEHFKEMVYESNNFLNRFNTLREELNQPVINHAKESKTKQELDDLVQEERNRQAPETIAAVRENKPPKKEGTKSSLKKEKQLVKKRIVDSLLIVGRKYNSSDRVDIDKLLTEVSDVIITQFAAREVNSDRLNGLIDQALVDVKESLLKHLNGDDSKTSRNNAIIETGVENYPVEEDPKIIRGKLTAKLLDRENTPQAIKNVEFIDEITRIAKDRDEALKMINVYNSLEKAHGLPKNIDLQVLSEIITRGNKSLVEELRSKVKEIHEKVSVNPEHAAIARDWLHRFDILQAAHVGIADVENKDQMMFLLINGANNLLESGVPSDETRASLKGAIANSQFCSLDKCLDYFDALKGADDKEKTQESLANIYEKLDIGDIQPGDGKLFIELATKNVSPNTVIQEDVKYAQMVTRVKNKDLLKRTTRFMGLIDDFDWVNERHSNLEHLLMELREEEPELHEYMMSRLEEADKKSKVERTCDRVDKYAKLKGLYTTTKDGQYEIEGDEYNRLYEKLEKITKGCYSDLIALEREEAQKLREEREKGEIVPVVEEHLEENNEEHAETIPETQPKTERDDDDYTM